MRLTIEGRIDLKRIKKSMKQPFYVWCLIVSAIFLIGSIAYVFIGQATNCFVCLAIGVILILGGYLSWQNDCILQKLEEQEKKE